MGFKDFFNKIGSGFTKVANKIGNGFKKAGTGIYSSVLKPAYTKVLKPVYEKAIVPVAKKATTFVSHSIDRVDKIADAGTGMVQNFGNLVSTISNSPLVILGIVGCGAYVMSRR